MSQDHTPTRPYGILPDPHEFERNQPEPGWNRPNVAYSPPSPGYNSNTWVSNGPPPFTWCGAKPDKLDEPVLFCQSYLLGYIAEMRRRHAEEWLRLDDEIRHLQALNQTLAKQALAEVPEPTQKRMTV